ncbi:unnamed protein product [Brassica napus]|uniref:(rape) hypothetical protein n=1 Tax=Brassica napus TaxID=3708 RepID=A0A816VYQ6_BRANA|nr:unnamed protein product [Brassica napus]
MDYFFFSTVSLCTSITPSVASLPPRFAANHRRRHYELQKRSISMGKARGVNNGVNQSSLDYLFGSGESPSAVAATMGTTTTTTTTTTTDGTGGRPVTTTTTTVTENKKIPAGVRGSPNNYFRSEGQNCGNFLTERPSTKVHAAPGGGSSLGYLFGGPSASADSAKK